MPPARAQRHGRAASSPEEWCPAPTDGVAVDLACRSSLPDMWKRERDGNRLPHTTGTRSVTIRLRAELSVQARRSEWARAGVSSWGSAQPW
ncbi:hypothetical protein DMH26_13565 [Streptomyces sp. WAC 05379]|nr:hypothetical protein DMH26_13565 [Streptomyces sp. WAC 05379]